MQLDSKFFSVSDNIQTTERKTVAVDGQMSVVSASDILSNSTDIEFDVPFFYGSIGSILSWYVGKYVPPVINSQYPVDLSLGLDIPVTFRQQVFLDLGAIPTNWITNPTKCTVRLGHNGSITGVSNGSLLLNEMIFESKSGTLSEVSIDNYSGDFDLVNFKKISSLIISTGSYWTKSQLDLSSIEEIALNYQTPNLYINNSDPSNTSLTDINISNLKRIQHFYFTTGHTSVTNIDFGGFSKIESVSGSFLLAANCPLTQSCVDDILVSLLKVAAIAVIDPLAFNSKYVDMTGPSSAPSAVGIAAKDELINTYGWTVTTN